MVRIFLRGETNEVVGDAIDKVAGDVSEVGQGDSNTEVVVVPMRSDEIVLQGLRP